MAILTKTELERGKVALMRPETVAALQKLMDAFERATGHKTTLPAFGGVRTTADQLQLLAWRADSGATYAVGGADTSRHVYGGAFDLHVLRLVGGKWAKVEGWAGGRIAPEYVKLGELGESLGLTWGGRWSGKDSDPYHFQLNESLGQARARWELHRRGLVQGGSINVRATGGAVAVGVLLLIVIASQWNE